MVDKNLILIKTDKIKEYLGFLRDLRQYPLNEFKTNPQIFGSAERFLQLAIESAIDIGNHLISDLRLRKPGTNREIFEILNEHGIITAGLRDSLCKMAQFRNILVHDYLRIDREIVFTILRRDLKNLEEFVISVINWIK
ncbi:MAG: type VII toxin-antitoxin system HepT family RNase toxin [Bacteroidota bacterium]